MTSKDEALKLALDVLVEINKLSIGENAICLPAEIDTAMDAAKEALAQPETPPECVTEAEKKAFAFGWWKAMEAQRLAQPKQEPVAWMHWLHGPVRLFMNKDEATLELERLNREYPVDKDHRKMRPLVFGDTTSPQRTWIGLDFETIEECFPEGPSVFEDAYGDNRTSPRWLHAFARAIEARLKEKNR